MHTPTNWQDYPATTTPITAAELLRMDKLGSEAYDLIDYTLSKIIGAETRTVTSVTVDASSTLYTNLWCFAPTGFSFANDGIIIRKNGELVPLSAYYLTPSNGTITFTGTTFAVGDAVTFAVYKNASAPVVPSGYEETDYYSFSGSQAINTGFTPTSGVLKVETALKYPAYLAPGMGSNFLIGGFNSAPTSYGSHSFQLFLTSGGQLEIALMDGGHTTMHKETPILPMNLLYEINAVFSSNIVSIELNGTTYSEENTLGITVPQREVWIGANGDPNVGGDVGYAMMNVNYLKLYDGSELVRDLVPVVRTSDNKAGFYDLVTENFYYS